MHQSEIQIRDPFVLTDFVKHKYYLFGTTDKDPWKSAGTGFDAYVSTDLINWQGPIQVFNPPRDFKGTHNFWAPEVHLWDNTYYMFATFIGSGLKRGTYILQSSSGSPLGPFRPLTNDSVTPSEWQCLDGTLHIDGANQPWLVFCHEWVEVNDGEICAVRLLSDLSASIGKPVVLFRASEASWPTPIARRDGSGIIDARVTDGPFVRRLKNNSLLMLWSSLHAKGYAMGYAVSTSGSILGPWKQSPEPILTCDGGHGMLFSQLNGQLSLTYHAPNDTPKERFHFYNVEEIEDGIQIVQNTGA